MSNIDQMDFARANNVNDGQLRIYSGLDGGAEVSKAFGATNLPTNIDEYPFEESRAYDLSVTAAAKAGLPVLDVSGGASRRMVVLERVAYLEQTRPDGGTDHFGYAIRLCVTVSKLETSSSLKLPVLAASAELGRIEAQWKISVVGLAGNKISDAILPPESLNVETFVVARQSLSDVIAVVRDPATTFTPQLIAHRPPVNARKQQAYESIGCAIALEAIRRGKTISWLERELNGHSPVSLSVAIDFYKNVAGEVIEGEPVPADARQLASGYLNGIRIRVDSDWI